MPKQEISSARTSINAKKVPRVFHLVRWYKGTINLDYGGGKYDIATEYLKEEGVTNLIYDPYNRDEKHNKYVLSTVERYGGANTVTCANVLNVIKEDEVVEDIVDNCYKYLKSGGVAYFYIYEGNGSGVGRATSAGYQRNERAKQYEGKISRTFGKAKAIGQLIVAIK